MPNLNKCIFMGNLTRDPEVRTTPQGTSVCKFAIAVNRQFKGKDGQMQKETDFINIVVWGRSGENCGKFLAKGRPVMVEGRLSCRPYECQDGQKKTITEIVADHVEFLGSGKSDQGHQQEHQEQEPEKADPRQLDLSDQTTPF